MYKSSETFKFNNEDLSYDEHIADICKTANVKIKSLGIMRNLICEVSQPTITCSELTIEILEEGVKYVQS